MRMIGLLIVVLVIAWVMVKYMDATVKPHVPVATQTEEQLGAEAGQPASNRYQSPMQKAEGVEEVLMEGVDQRREQIEEQGQ